MNWKDVAKYFVHGIAFSILFLIFFFVWAFILVFLTAIGSFIGLILGFGLLFLIVGFLNSVISTYLWFEVETSLTDLFVHGLVLFIVLLILDVITVFLPSLAFPGTATRVITLFTSAFLYGFVAKRIARFWELEYRARAYVEWAPDRRPTQKRARRD